MVPREGERQPRSWVACKSQERVISLPPFPIFLSLKSAFSHPAFPKGWVLIPCPLSWMPGGGQSILLVLGQHMDLSVVDYP